VGGRGAARRRPRGRLRGASLVAILSQAYAEEVFTGNLQSRNTAAIPFRYSHFSCNALLTGRVDKGRLRGAPGCPYFFCVCFPAWCSQAGVTRGRRKAPRTLTLLTHAIEISTRPAALAPCPELDLGEAANPSKRTRSSSSSPPSSAFIAPCAAAGSSNPGQPLLLFFPSFRRIRMRGEGQNQLVSVFAGVRVRGDSTVPAYDIDRPGRVWLDADPPV
jgi:hypothetical protein